ncbi:MAG: heat-shock protein [Pirellulaceae bacterium]|nr:MAG: heat-shock protein [Pirellulaceae bacterium]
MADTVVKTEQQPAEVATAERTRSGQTYSPRFDIVETADELVLMGDLPGVSPESLDVQFENNVLTIVGKVEPRYRDVNLLYAEYGIGDFFRQFTIGETIDASRISAELHNGVLTLHLPKTEAVKPRRIEIKAV